MANMNDVFEIQEVGSRIGMELRDGKVSAVGSTPRIRRLNEQLHASRPNLEMQRTRVFTDYYKNHESESNLKKRYNALARVYETLPINIVEGERLLGWAGSKIRAHNFAIEAHAHWMAEDIPTLDTRDFDPWQITEEEKKELLEIHIPYWKEKTLTAKWRAQVTQPDVLMYSGYTDCSNFLSNPGSHFIPDYRRLLKIGFCGYAKICEEKLAAMDESLPDNVGKREYYEGLLEVINGIRKYGMRVYKAAIVESGKWDDPARQKELVAAANRIRKITWDVPETFPEALHLVWMVCMMLNVECSGPSIGLGRFDQYMWPFLEKDLKEGRLTILDAQEWMEEFNIKCCNIPWFMPEALCHYFGGYYRWGGQYSVGGVNAKGEDAVNLLSYICLRSSRFTRTTAPAIHVLLSEKNPQSFLDEAIKLSAEGLGHPSFFDVETQHQMMKRHGRGLTGENNFTEEEINERCQALGCVEIVMEGWSHGHLNANITNLGNTLSVTLNNGVLPKQCPGFGAGTVIGKRTGDPLTFDTFDKLYDAVVDQFRYQTDLCHAHMLVIEKLIAEEHQMPLSSMLLTGSIEAGIDANSGSSLHPTGPAYDLSGIADLADSMIAMKHLIYDEKKITMQQLLEALDADFVGYEDIRKMCLDAPKYGNGLDEPDEMVSRLLHDFGEIVSSKESWKARGCYSNAGIQPTQANVGCGEKCWALPNGRKGLAPFADAMSAEHGMDKKGPLGAVRSYGHVDHTSMRNGTLLNMWISKSELIKQYA